MEVRVHQTSAQRVCACVTKSDIRRIGQDNATFALTSVLQTLMLQDDTKSRPNAKALYPQMFVVESTISDSLRSIEPEDFNSFPGL